MERVQGQPDRNQFPFVLLFFRTSNSDLAMGIEWSAWGLAKERIQDSIGFNFTLNAQGLFYVNYGDVQVKTGQPMEAARQSSLLVAGLKTDSCGIDRIRATSDKFHLFAKL